MSKSQKRSNKEVRKPKAVKGAATPAVSPLGSGSAFAPKKRK